MMTCSRPLKPADALGNIMGLTVSIYDSVLKYADTRRQNS
jgi:hypothetical protein